MIKLFLSSHGKMASGIKSTLSILAGDTSKLEVFDAYIDDSSVQDHLDEFFKSVSADDQVLLMSDILGGSVNTAMCQYLERPNTQLVAGVNLAFVLQMMFEENLSPERIDEVVEESRNGLQRIEMKKTEETSSDDDFF
ncbi:MAG: hypothetical protein Q4D13_04950 [Erysipelotrichaceae bacterium]|nr:hypothetical protein [Erysipelotrichaceae bacterium]